MALSYFAESLVVTIVGLNMGFRKQVFDAWKSFFLRKMLSTSQNRYKQDIQTADCSATSR
jgi:hypothetical protein